MNKKYKLLKDNIKILSDGRFLYRIKALKEINTLTGMVNAGDLGGYIEGEHNLSQEGDCWVNDRALVFGNAQVKDDAYVTGSASVFGDAIISNKGLVFNHAKVFGKALVSDEASVCQNAKVYGQAKVLNKSVVKENSEVFGHTIVSNSTLLSCVPEEVSVGNDLD